MTARSVAIIQARMASSRLPGKVLMDIEGVAMLGRVVERTRRAQMLAQVVLATSTDAADDPIHEYCRSGDIPCARGSHFDVLDRYYKAAQQTKADIVVRITADCPLIDSALIDDAIQTLSGTSPPQATGAAGGSTEFDFAATRLPPPWKRTYPIGLDVEVCTFEVLERAWREARGPADREHVMPYIYRGVDPMPRDSHVSTGASSLGFRIAVLNHASDLGSFRWTVDTAQDLEFVRQVFSNFGGRSDFSWSAVLDLLLSQPQLASINAGVRHNTLKDTDGRAHGADA